MFNLPHCNLALGLALLLPSTAAAEDRGDPDRHRTLHQDDVRPEDPASDLQPLAQDCTQPRDWDPMPLPEVIVDNGPNAPIGTAPDIHLALAEAANLGDLNGDGVVAICVEPGTYAGGFVLRLSRFSVPVVLYSSRGASATAIRGGKGDGHVTHAVVVDGEDANIVHHRDWRRDAWIRGFDISGYGDRVVPVDSSPFDFGIDTGDGGPPIEPLLGGRTDLDGGAALLAIEASLGLDWMVFNSNQDGGARGRGPADRLRHLGRQQPPGRELQRGRRRGDLGRGVALVGFADGVLRERGSTRRGGARSGRGR